MEESYVCWEKINQIGQIYTPRTG